MSLHARLARPADSVQRSGTGREDVVRRTQSASWRMRTNEHVHTPTKMIVEQIPDGVERYALVLRPPARRPEPSASGNDRQTAPDLGHQIRGRRTPARLQRRL